MTVTTFRALDGSLAHGCTIQRGDVVPAVVVSEQQGASDEPVMLSRSLADSIADCGISITFRSAGLAWRALAGRPQAARRSEEPRRPRSAILSSDAGTTPGAALDLGGNPPRTRSGRRLSHEWDAAFPDREKTATMIRSLEDSLTHVSALR